MVAANQGSEHAIQAFEDTIDLSLVCDRTYKGNTIETTIAIPTKISVPIQKFLATVG